MYFYPNEKKTSHLYPTRFSNVKPTNKVKECIILDFN